MDRLRFWTITAVYCSPMQLFNSLSPSALLESLRPRFIPLVIDLNNELTLREDILSNGLICRPAK